MDSAGGLLLVIGFFVLVRTDDPDANPADSTEFRCQYVMPLYKMTMRDASPCLESQLTDDSRLLLFDIFNEYRRNISRGEKTASRYNNVFEVNYHWICEYIAAYVINNKIKETLLPKNTLQDLISEIEGVVKAEGIDLGSLTSLVGDSEMLNVTVFDTILDASNQNDFIKDFVSRLSEMTDPYLTIEQQKVMWPGTTHFGCSIRFNDPSSSRKRRDGKTLNHITCVFTTYNATDQKLVEGTMTNESCQDAIPFGQLDEGADLCRDYQFQGTLGGVDIPCQFFYNTSAENFTLPVSSCNGEDPRTDSAFLSWPAGYEKMIINFNGKRMMFTFIKDYKNDSEPGGALKLHSIPIHAIFLIVFAHKFYF